MSQGLTKREKVLVSIAGILVLFFVVYQGVFSPLNSAMNILEERRAELSKEKELLNIKLRREEAIREARDNNKALYEEIEQRYPQVMPNEEIDRLLTGICLQCGLNPVMLGMMDIEPYSLTEDKYLPDYGTPQNPAVFYVVSANMNLIGDYDAVKQLISIVEDTPYIRIKRLNYFNAQEAGSTNSPNVSILFEVTMLNG